ncbi:UNVERIFIED_CONTAM: hypothetical protein K2H54_063246 [Gekko kuhli]
MSLKKNRRSLPVGICQSCGTPEGNQRMLMWPRSHSLGDLQGEIVTKTEDSEKKVDGFPQSALDLTKKSISFDGSGQMTEQLVAKNKGGTVSLKGKAKELHFSAAIPSSGTFPLFLPQNNEVQSSLLSHDITWTLLENHKKSSSDVGRTDHSSVLKEITEAEQKYVVPCSPDVPSLPAKKTTSSSPVDVHVLTFCKPSPEQEPSSPSCVRPPWFSDLPETSSIQQHVLKLGPSSTRKTSCNRGLDLEMLIENKLQSEDIDLTEDPYSDKHGRCGIPEALVQRYSEDLEQPEKEVATNMDQIRVKQLRKQHRMAIPSGGLTEIYRKPVSPGHITSIADWLVSIGLPMYSSSLMAAGVNDLSKVPSLSPTCLQEAGIREERHISKLLAAARLFSSETM